MIIYIHGWGSVGIGSGKFNFLKEAFPEEKVVTGDFPIHDWEASLEEIESLIDDKDSWLLFVGSSTGALYAEYLADKYYPEFFSRALLINPITNPEQLRKFLGENKNYKTGEKFEFTQAQLEAFKVSEYDNERLVLIDKGDEVLPYQIAAGHFPKDDVILFEGGSHRFEHLSESKEQISQLYFRFGTEGLGND